LQSQVITEFGKPLQCLESPTPTPRGTEVLLRVEHCGVCHSDLHIHQGYFDLGGGARMPMRPALPHTLGHEVAGEVVALGPRARGVSLGEHRALYPWIGCGLCPVCRSGEEQYCEDPRIVGCSSQAGGGYATHVLAPHPRYLLDYGPTPPPLAAAYMCSGLTAYGAMTKFAKLRPRDDVLIVGAGGVGMMGLQFAKHLFKKAPLVADIDESRLQAAMGAGAKAVYNTRDPEALAKLKADTGGGARGVVDFVGSEATFAFCTQAVRRNGRIVIVGLYGGGMSMPIPMFPLRALTVGGSYVGSLAQAKAMMFLVREGKIDPIPVRDAPLSSVNDVLDDLRAGRVIGRVVLAP
jgi:D-arabinose 1-dehydrogenase-like Zn-dependent alcohol dehydrogenase